MSFPPLNNTSDYDVYTTKYLQNLALQIQLNQKNFNENVAYMKTGVQQTERPDQRSIEERAGDVEKLKIQARVMLNKISDASNASEVLDYLVKNGELLFFFIQQFPAIEKIVKEQFSGGIRAPMLISMIYKKFTQQQEESLLPESSEFDIVSNVMTAEDADRIFKETKNDILKQELINMQGLLIPEKELNRIVNDPVKYMEELKFYSEIFKNSPNVEDYNRLIEEYNDAPLKDELNNYDLERAEDNLIAKINAYIPEATSKIPTTGVKKFKQPITKERTIPKERPTRTTQKTEGERKLMKAKKQTLEQITTQSPVLKKSPTPEVQNVVISQLKEKRKQKEEAEKQKQIEADIKQKELESEASSKISKFYKKKVRGKDLVPRKKRTSKAEMIAKRLPEAPTNPPILIPRAPQNIPLPEETEEEKQVPTTGSGLLNKHEQQTHRFKVLKGEILAGNTSKKLIQEMKTLVKQLVKSGELTLDQSSGILKELKTL